MTAYDWRADDSDFAAEWDEALEDATDDLEREAVRRAKDGSDTLLIFLLKGRRPDTYRENIKTEHSGSTQLVVSYSNNWRDEGVPQ